MATDPTDDKVYENLSLQDFIRHLSPQVARQREEILDLNKKGFVPSYDPMFRETAPPVEDKKDSKVNRAARRQLALKERKAAKKGNGKKG